jgi:ribosomal protein L6P/L9E
LGFKVIKENKFLIFFLGYSHKIQFNLIENFEFLILGTKNRILKLFCLDLVKLNQISFLIQLLRTPGIYKYKGIYFDRKISLLKAGKKYFSFS